MYIFLVRAVVLLFRVFSAMILVECIMSWFVRPGSSMYRVYCRLNELVAPLVSPFRRITMPVAYRTGIDFAPWLALIAMDIVRDLILIVLRMIFV